jgi:hypothetical protein
VAITSVIDLEQALATEKKQHQELIDWLSKLTPSEKVSLWSKNGDAHGIFNLDSEQLTDKYYRKYHTDTYGG